MEFKTSVCSDGRLTTIKVPFNAKELFSIPKGTIFVYGTINGIPYRSKLLSKGRGMQVMVIDKKLQNALGYTGISLTVTVVMNCDNGKNNPDNVINTSIDTSHLNKINFIIQRKSVRIFNGNPVEEDKLDAILYSGMHAPSAKNKRPFHFVVVTDREILKNFAEINPNGKMLAVSPCCIVVCGDSNTEGNHDFLVESCSAATQNMLLAIHALGLGGVWCGVIRGKDWSKLITDKLNLPLKVSPVSVIALGYPSGNPMGQPLEQNKFTASYDKSQIHYGVW